MTLDEAFARTIAVRNSRREYFELVMGDEYRRDYEAMTEILNYIGRLESESVHLQRVVENLTRDNKRLFTANKRELLRTGSA